MGFITIQTWHIVSGSAPPSEEFHSLPPLSPAWGSVPAGPWRVGSLGLPHWPHDAPFLPSPPTRLGVRRIPVPDDVDGVNPCCSIKNRISFWSMNISLNKSSTVSPIPDEQRSMPDLTSPFSVVWTTEPISSTSPSLKPVQLVLTALLKSLRSFRFLVRINYRWIDIKGIHTAISIAIMLFSNHLK